MRGYCDNIEKRTIENEDFRHVLYTGHNLQVVLFTRFLMARDAVLKNEQ